MTIDTKERIDPYNFKAGVYQHYKGDTYTALMLVRHHETRELSVVYLSHKYGTLSQREWATEGKDSWTDMVPYRDKFGNMTGEYVLRFKLVSPMPFDVGGKRG